MQRVLPSEGQLSAQNPLSAHPLTAARRSPGLAGPPGEASVPPPARRSKLAVMVASTGGTDCGTKVSCGGAPTAPAYRGGDDPVSDGAANSSSRGQHGHTAAFGV